MKRRGFALIELLVVMTIIGILANLAIPIVRTVKVKAQAAQVVGDINVIRTAVFDYYAEYQDFPRTGSWRAIPRDLAPSLPGGFVFQRDRTDYRWVRFNQRQAARTGRTGVIRARIREPELRQAVTGLYRGDWVFGRGNQLLIYLE